MENNSNYYKYVYLWLLLSLTMAFLLFSHLLEVFPENVARWLAEPSLIRLSNFNGHEMSFFYVITSIEVLIVGLLLDKFGIRIVTGLSAIVCLLGAFFFAHVNSQSTLFLIFSRILISGGLAFVSIGYMKVVAGVMPPGRFALMAGIYGSAALLGAIFGDVPTAGWLVYTWQQTIIATASAVLILAVLFSILLRDDQQTLYLPAWQDLRLTLKNPQNWLLAAYSGLAFAPIAILTLMAGKPFFTESYQYTHTEIVALGVFLLSGLSIGAPVIGFLSGKIKRRRAIMLAGILIQELTFIPLIYLSQTPFWLNAVLLLLFGFASSAFILSFTLGKESNQLTVVGTMMSVIKIGILLITAITGQLFGKCLNWAWDGKIVGGVRYFSTFDYHVAFFIFPVYLFLGFILLLFVDEPIF